MAASSVRESPRLCPGGPAGIPSGSGFTLEAIFTTLIQAAMVVGILISLVYLCYGGFYWVQSKGDKETLDKARRIITYSILGLIVMSLALVIVNLLIAIVGSSVSIILLKVFTNT